MKRAYITTIAVCLALLLLFATLYSAWDAPKATEVLKVGFIYANDEMTPGARNFALTQEDLVRTYGDRVQVLKRNNVSEQETFEPLTDLVNKGCDIVFVYSHTSQVVEVAAQHPSVQFCQISRSAAPLGGTPENYHTFNAAAHEGRYVSGIAAGMKLRAMLDAGDIRPEEAQVGFVGAREDPETLSAAAAFLLGVRSVVPEATMRLRCTGTWISYSLEKACAEKLIHEGCSVIAQYTGTIGPAVACEASAAGRDVYFVGQDQSMIDIAPRSTLVSVRTNWTPYVLGAVEAVMNRQPIERLVKGSVHGNDVCAGFDRDWIQVLELNKQNAVDGVEKAMERAVEALRKGKLEVFRGEYTATDPHVPSDTLSLSAGYRENADGSAPTFHYLLDGVMALEGE